MDGSPTPDQNWLDRLVDGELSDSERRALLESIAAQPDGEGWRRCALAFLEDQCWREALGPIARPELAEARPEFTQQPSRMAWSVVRSPFLQAAAAVLVAFAGGWLAGGRLTTSPEPHLQKLQVAQGPIGPRSQAVQGGGPIQNQGQAQNQERPILLPDVINEPPTPNWQTVGYVQLPAENGQGEDVRVPVLAGPGLDDDWLRKQPPALPDSLRAQWENQGYRVEQRRRLVSVEMEDGRYLSIPVDEVDLHFVGPTTF